MVATEFTLAGSRGSFARWDSWRNQNPIRKLLADKGIKQTYLASALPVSTNTVQRWLVGTSKPTPANIILLADRIGVSCVELSAALEAWYLARSEI